MILDFVLIPAAKYPVVSMFIIQGALWGNIYPLVKLPKEELKFNLMLLVYIPDPLVIEFFGLLILIDCIWLLLKNELFKP